MHVPPMYERPAAPDAWHHVRAPGGYEWWQIQALDAQTPSRLVVSFYDGHPFDPDYRRHYRSYLRHPTRVAPPIAQRYRFVHCCWWEGESLIAECLTRPRDAADFAASAVHADVRSGDSHFKRMQDGQYVLTVEGGSIVWRRGRAIASGQTLSVDVRFRPLASPSGNASEVDEQIILAATAREHRWFAGNSLCWMEGEVSLTGDQGRVRGATVSGSAYHDHHFGTGPIAPEITSWMRGCALAGDARRHAGAAISLHYARPADHSLPPELLAIRSDDRGVRQLPVDVSSNLWFFDQRYPDVIDLRPQLWLGAPRLLHVTPFETTFAYDCKIDGELASPAICQFPPGRSFRSTLSQATVAAANTGLPPTTGNS